jgi:hypothetical protein
MSASTPGEDTFTETGNRPGKKTVRAHDSNMRVFLCPNHLEHTQIPFARCNMCFLHRLSSLLMLTVRLLVIHPALQHRQGQHGAGGGARVHAGLRQADLQGRPPRQAQVGYFCTIRAVLSPRRLCVSTHYRCVLQRGFVV